MESSNVHNMHGDDLRPIVDICSNATSSLARPYRGALTWLFPSLFVMIASRLINCGHGVHGIFGSLADARTDAAANLYINDNRRIM
ncbi:hypothetical protein Aduo_011133 [Ancylostoma duodenale]